MAPKPKKLSVVVFSDELDKVHSAFTLACSAATVNYEVNMFFTYWGLNAVTRFAPVASAETGFVQKISKKKDLLKLSRYHFFGYGTALFRRLIKEHHVASLSDLYKTARALGVKFYACDTAIKVMGFTPEQLSACVDDVVRVSRMLELSEDGQLIQI